MVPTRHITGLLLVFNRIKQTAIADELNHFVIYDLSMKGLNIIRQNLINLPQIVFEVTDACNLRCKYCGFASLYEGYDKRTNQNLSFPIAKNILDYLASIWRSECLPSSQTPLTIGFYGGEPLLNMTLVKQIVEYSRLLQGIGKTVIFNMTTNAMLLDRYADYLADNEFRLLISLDGDEEGHGYRVDVNGNNSFNRVFQNVKMLQNKHPHYFEKFVMFNSVLHNKNSVESIFYFIKGSFGKEPSISPLSNSGVRPEMLEEFKSTYRDYMDSIDSSSYCERLKEDLFANNPQTINVWDYLQFESGNMYRDFNDLLRSDNANRIISTGTCTPFSKKMFITVNGKILQCERISHKHALGTVNEHEVKLDLDEVQQKYYESIKRFSSLCNNCARKKNCPQCVLQIDENTSPSMCDSYMTIQQGEVGKLNALLYLKKNPSLYKRLMSNLVARR